MPRQLFILARDSSWLSGRLTIAPAANSPDTRLTRPSQRRAYVAAPQAMADRTRTMIPGAERTP